MLEQFLQAIIAQMQEPKADLEKNLRALLSEMVTRMDLVSQEEFMRQQTALQQAQLNIEQLLVQIDQLHARLDTQSNSTAQ